jgi:hypothetical protein
MRCCLLALFLAVSALPVSSQTIPTINSLTPHQNSVRVRFSEKPFNGSGWWKVFWGTSPTNLNHGKLGETTGDSSATSIGGLRSSTVYYFKVEFFVSPGASHYFFSSVSSVKTLPSRQQK